jgi:trigger factor
MNLKTMNITKHNIDDLNAVLKVKVGPEDYAGKVESALKEYQKKANMPGFRPGKVPAGMIKKMYGKSILVDEINKLLNDSLYRYINENKIEVLGNPLPKKEDDVHIDWDNQQEFEFSYEVGLAPQFNIDLSSKNKFTNYVINVDDQLIDKYVSDISKRYGKVTNPEEASTEDVLFGEFTELDQSGNPKEGGIIKNSSLAVDRIKSDSLKNKLVGLKKQDQVTFKASDVSENFSDLGAMLGISKESAESFNSDLRFTVFNISRMQGADLNEELFTKVYGNEVKSLEEFRAKIKEELESMFKADSEKRLKNDIMSFLIENLQLQLPDEFLKRWIVAVNEKPLDREQIEKEYPQYSKGLRWQLIENKLIRENNIKVDAEEATEYIKSLIREQYRKYNAAEMDEEELTATAKRVFSDEKEAQKIFEKLYADKILTLLQSSYTIEDKKVSYEEFFKA